MDSNVTGRSTFSGWKNTAIRAALRKLCVHENVTYGHDFRVGRGSVISSPHGLEIGDAVSVGPYSVIQVDGRIDDFVLIGMGVQIVGRDDHAINEVGRPYVLSTWVADRPESPRDSVTIGRDVWIGGKATILGGVSIGEGSLVGSASVVTSDLPPYSIAVGNPARIVGERFDTQSRAAHSAALDELCAQRFPATTRSVDRVS